jgi:tetratricopeptide (TPR) repeat protein
MSTQEIGRTLNAAYLVTGNIQRAGTRLRITAELVRAATGARVWGDQYDRPAADLLAIQADIAGAVASGIAGRLLPGERARLAARPTSSPEAYDHYLRGNRFSAGQVEASVIGAITEYEAALRVDPSFTAARGRLAYAYALVLNWALRPGGMTPESVAARATHEADRALREDSANSAAWMGRGYAMFMRGRPGELQLSLASFRRAVEVNPADDIARSSHASALRRVGHFEESEREYHAALVLNPAYPQAVGDLGFIEYSLRHFAQARQWYDSALALDSTQYNSRALRARLRMEQADTVGALEDARSALGHAGPGDQVRLSAALAEIEARAGRMTDARERLQRVYEQLGWPSGRPASAVSVRVAYEVALAAAATGDRDAALTILEHASPRGPWLWSYLVFPAFDPIRREPRFQQVYREARPAGAEPVPGVDP